MSNAAAEKIETNNLVPMAGATLTPLDMLDRAVAHGASPEVIEKFMALHERWEATQARKAFDKAIAVAKSKIKPIIKNRDGHNSRYADLAAIANVVDPILSAEGLTYRFRTTQTDRINVTCILFGHGHSEESSLSGPPDTSGSKNAIQAIGSTLTYLQRYSLSQALGLAAANDDNGAAANTGGIVTDEQAQKLRDLLTETKADLARFLKWAKAESVADLPAAKFEAAVAMLNAKKATKKAEVQS